MKSRFNWWRDPKTFTCDIDAALKMYEMFFIKNRSMKLWEYWLNFLHNDKESTLHFKLISGIKKRLDLFDNTDRRGTPRNKFDPIAETWIPKKEIYEHKRRW